MAKLKDLKVGTCWLTIEYFGPTYYFVKILTRPYDHPISGKKIVNVQEIYLYHNGLICKAKFVSGFCLDGLHEWKSISKERFEFLWYSMTDTFPP